MEEIGLIKQLLIINWLKMMMCRILVIIIAIMLFPLETTSQQKLVKILVASSYIEESAYQPVADVMSGCIIRELKRAGGIEVIDRERAEDFIRKDGGKGWVATRQQAMRVGKALEADVVIYSTIKKNYNSFIYDIAFYEVRNDIIQRILHGSFLSSTSASEIGRKLKKEIDKLKMYIPSPSELADPGVMIRDTTIDPDNLPKFHEIEDFPTISRYGAIEQVFNYFRVFPGEREYQRLESGTRIMRFSFRKELEEDLTTRFNLYNVYADFAIRHNLQAFFINDCSTRAVNLLLANNIPVFYNDDLILGYTNLLSDGSCIFRTLTSKVFDTSEMSHRNRMVVMFIVPKPGRKGGVSKDYLEYAIGRYKDEWGEIPTLVEVNEGLLDFKSNVLD